MVPSEIAQLMVLSEADHCGCRYLNLDVRVYEHGEEGVIV